MTTLMRSPAVRSRAAAFAATGLMLRASASAHAAEAAAPVVDSGDTAWVLTASALVLMMTLPGLALFYGGLVRSKNVLNVLMQCMLSAGIVGVLWILLGYSLAFGTGNAFIGDFSKAGLSGVSLDSVVANFASPPRNIPEYVFIMFQAMFAIITPALMLGAIAERMKVSVWIAFMTPSRGGARGVIAGAAIEWMHRGKPTALGGATAAVAGLVAITPACGNVSPMGAIAVGFGVVIVSYSACMFMKPAFGYDDS